MNLFYPYKGQWWIINGTHMKRNKCYSHEKVL